MLKGFFGMITQIFLLRASRTESQHKLIKVYGLEVFSPNKTKFSPFFQVHILSHYWKNICLIQVQVIRFILNYSTCILNYVILAFPTDKFWARTFSKLPEKLFGLPKTQSDTMDISAVYPLPAAVLKLSSEAKDLTKSYFRVQSEP